ncbi:MAG: hypothetical protein A2842_00650 [Candidatus Wildermuthbacteria bacterium RIFCSPHIGHO2_01_FULL_48_25]|uniref:Uncharacterized protein n=1 Tax=Candidatus Wildermuthbacteria bacterium RIFCSPLOWO2_01_FULL_48_16 TaxID=1802461 RepID=A0A1G2RM24_9BACT|nr:MAG: hypothetical protein A2842_00650 [Candidatus Wildermuthbacteria bacterium RIFCSPHIGHO2_01_FULL_48_25]OHA73061.1 MAG: hypothetical protein A3B24_01460 [Candidatus Wildermuthbacteria bacterium RIFCSPLOWO2_01_FULL_48_16]
MGESELVRERRLVQMKYSARLVTALAALALLVVAIVGLSTRAEASAVPVDFETTVIVQSIDLPGTLDLEGGGADVLATTQIDVTTFDDPTTPAFTLVAEHDVGSQLDTSLTTLAVDQTHDVLAAPEAASLITTTTDDATTRNIGIATGAVALLTIPFGLFAWRTRKDARAHAPFESSFVDSGTDDGRHGTTQSGADRTARRSGTPYDPRE